ncbi:signal peptidase I [Geomesophilobacter sediminis]|uniref:Signal peptidase I n=1 Tax=Geomesophilobacter sediminis TaxID=2798584 RepID=A0A8J7S882_9BACT|nr:signal peptidase I [Geomesophilobacter sediminis]MBJ6727417.1 signal peptidase I [Geomesophilobacter sediminis]
MSNLSATTAPQDATVKTKSTTREYIESLLWALLIAMVVRYCFVEAFKIPSGSMEDTLLIGDHLFVNKMVYGIKLPFSDKRILRIHAPERGDIMVFQFPEDRSKDFIKRVIGVPGDQVEVRDKQVFVNGVPYRNPHEVHKESGIIPRDAAPRDNFGPVRVPAGSYFMMGDNRDRSYDSRFWGFVTDSDIKGKAMIKYWSWDSENSRVRWNRIGGVIN